MSCTCYSDVLQANSLPHWSSGYNLFFYLFIVFLGLHPRHMEVPRLGVKLELQVLAYTTATAMPDLSCVCNSHHSSWQHQILNPMSEARDRTCNLMVPSQTCFCCTMTETPEIIFYGQIILCLWVWGKRVGYFYPLLYLQLRLHAKTLSYDT